MNKNIIALLFMLSASSQAGTLLLECNNQDVVLFEPQAGEVYLEIPHTSFIAEYIGTKIDGNVKTMTFLGMVDRIKVDLIVVKGTSMTLKHYTEHKCELADSTVN